MTVRKFRSIEEMNAADKERWRACDDPALPQLIHALWAQAGGLLPPALPRGVRKYRSYEALLADREKWEDERIARIRAERLRK